jgi:hypothetical protein
MPLISVYEDSVSKHTSPCRSCQAPITWAETLAGKRMPFDGEIVAVRTERERATARAILVIDTAVTTSHFATCPDASTWRGRKRT